MLTFGEHSTRKFKGHSNLEHPKSRVSKFTTFLKLSRDFRIPKKDTFYY